MKAHVILRTDSGVAFEDTVDDVTSTSEAIIYALGVCARRFGPKCSLRCEASMLINTDRMHTTLESRATKEEAA